MSATHSRIRFFAGDLVATSASCALIALIVGLAMPVAWPSWAAMAMGMAVGMILSIPCWLVAGFCLGMIEPMLQIMLGGMLAGMAGGMAIARDPRADAVELLLLGLACGAATSLAIACSDWALRTWGDECR